MKHGSEALKEPDGVLRVGLVLRHVDDVVENGGDIFQSRNLPGGKDMEEGRECDHHGLVMLLELLTERLESLDVPALGRDHIDQGDHLLGQDVNGSIQIDEMLRAFRRCPVFRSQDSRFISPVCREDGEAGTSRAGRNALRSVTLDEVSSGSGCTSSGACTSVFWADLGTVRRARAHAF